MSSDLPKVLVAVGTLFSDWTDPKAGFGARLEVVETDATLDDVNRWWMRGTKFRLVETTGEATPNIVVQIGVVYADWLNPETSFDVGLQVVETDATAADGHRWKTEGTRFRLVEIADEQGHNHPVGMETRGAFPVDEQDQLDQNSTTSDDRTKVWIVMYESHMDRDFAGVFSTRELAEQHAETDPDFYVHDAWMYHKMPAGRLELWGDYDG